MTIVTNRAGRARSDAEYCGITHKSGRIFGTDALVNIRMKVVAALTLLFAVLSGAEIVIQEQILMPSFAKLERADAEAAMQRVRAAMERTRDGLAIAAADWGNWADAYRFAADHNPEFAAMNVTPLSLRQLQANALLIVDEHGGVVLNSADHVHTGLDLRQTIITDGELAPDFPWRRWLGTRQSVNGLLRTNLGPMLVTGAPILNGGGGGEPRGMVIMGRLLTPARLREIASQTQVDVDFVHDDGAIAAGQTVTSAAVTRIYGAFDDINGRHLMTLRADVPRTISAAGRKAILYATVSALTAAVLALLALLVILDRVVLAPLTRVTRHAVAIGQVPDLTAKLDFRSEDEIGVLAREFDHMVARVAESRRQLVDQSFNAGVAELARGVLHNIGNAITPLGVRLRSLESRLRSAPVADLQLAVAELAAAEVATARRADLLRFAQLGCGEMAVLVQDARDGVAVMLRQTDIVQATLTEQLRSTDNRHVVERVSLPELVAQSLEIVPDASRQRLVVDADESLRRVGVVSVARTVLRLVLQNLIINAADAVRDAGKDRGMLRLAAEIVREADGDRLHLHCKDDGIGIDREKLGKVFEKGYSTKPRESNSGIGLHWCANVIAALGGRIWAASEGPGHGASMHVILPLPPPTPQATPAT